MSDDYYDEPEIFFGFGGVHDLNDHESESPRLLGMRSVSDGAAWAMHKGKAKPKRRAMGFQKPSRVRRGR